MTNVGDDERGRRRTWEMTTCQMTTGEMTTRGDDDGEMTTRRMSATPADYAAKRDLRVIPSTLLYRVRSFAR